MIGTQNVGSIEYDARINTKQLKSDAAEAQRVTQGAANHMGASLDEADSKSSNVLGNIMGKVKAVSLATVAAVSAAGVATAAFGVKSAADFQQTRIGLENMLGSADKARSLLTDISKFAAETPFEFPELAQATRQLVAFGFSGEAAFETMKQLGDVSAAVGAPINDLAYLMGTLKTQGRAFTIDIRQFAQRGIPIYEYLAKVLKTNEKSISEMIEAGKIGFPEVQKAFQAMTAEGGKFHGTMAKQSKSLTGIFSTLKDNIGQTVREMVGITVAGDIKPGSLMDWLLKAGESAIVNLPIMIKNVGLGISALVGAFQEGDVTSTGFIGNLEKLGVIARQVYDYLEPKYKALWTTISTELIPVLTKLWKEVLEPMAPVIGTVLVVALGLAIDWTRILISTASQLVDASINMVNHIKDFIGWLGQMYDKLSSGGGAWQSFRNAADRTLGPIDELIGAVIRQIDNLINKLGGVESQANRAKNALGGVVQTGIKSGLQNVIPGLRFLPGFASGTNFAPGGPAIVGENGPELVNLPRGSQVIPNHQLDSEMGGSRIENNIGNIYISKEADAENWLKRLTQDQEIIGKGLTPQTRYA